jgi:hypothetical protein
VIDIAKSRQMNRPYAEAQACATEEMTLVPLIGATAVPSLIHPIGWPP